MSKNVNPWVLRGLIIAVLATVALLWVLAKPLPETPLPTPTPTRTRIPTPALSADRTSEVEGDTSTHTPKPSPTPTATPTFTPNPTDTSTPTAALTATPEGPTAIPTTEVVEAPVVRPSVELAGRVEPHTYFSRITGQEEPYRIYLPPGYDTSGQQYPALYLFHGWPYDESHWDNLGVDEIADAAIQAGTLPPFIIVLPGADPDGIFVNTAGGEYSFEGQVVVDLIPHIDATYRTLTTREGRAVGGISRGAVWSLEIGFRHADMFAAVGGHSPALKYNQAPDAYDPFNLLGQPRVAELRIYLDAGDADWALVGTQSLHEALDAQGIPNQFVVHSGGHSDGLWAANVGEYLGFYAAGW
ncbi:MAG: esterase family protein [Anaerolineae bacterium]|nr:esterase family protein [Anaerolineae bacterium]